MACLKVSYLGVSFSIFFFFSGKLKEFDFSLTPFSFTVDNSLNHCVW